MLVCIQHLDKYTYCPCARVRARMCVCVCVSVPPVWMPGTHNVSGMPEPDSLCPGDQHVCGGWGWSERDTPARPGHTLNVCFWCMCG